MGNIRDKIKLSEDEVAEYLRSSKTLIMATVNHDGWPHVVPMWYAIIDGLVHMHTYRTSQKVRNLERDSRGSALVEDGTIYNELRGVFMRGHYEIRDDPELCFRIGIESAAKYMNTDEASAAPFVREQVRKRVALIFHPQKITSWDHRRLSSAS